MRKMEPRKEYDIKLHMTEKIHVLTAFYTVLQMYTFIIIGASVVPVFSSDTYFSFGAPVTIAADPLNTETINQNSIIAGISFFFVVDRICTLAAEEAISHVDTPFPVLKYVMIITYYMRYAAHIVFMRTQVSFALAIVVADLLGYTLFKWVSINRRFLGYTNWALSQRRALIFLTLVQVAEIPCFLLIYVFSGLFANGLYFNIGPPLVVFSAEKVSSEVAYWIILIVSFLDMLLSCAVRNNIEAWSTGTLQNSDKDHEELGMNSWEARLVSAARMIMYYLRIMFVYSFLTTQYIFVPIYITADIIATVVYDSRCEERAAIRQNHEKNKREISELSAREREECSEHDSTRIILLAMAQAIETVIIMIVIILSHWFTESYFEWAKHIIVFDVDISSPPQIKLLLAYVAFDRISATLYNNVILPDFNNWLYTPSDEYDGKELSRIYNRWHILWILVIMRANNWFRFIIQIQFILSNYSFVVIAAAVDIPLSMIVNERHIRYKNHKGQVAFTESILRSFKEKRKQT